MPELIKLDQAIDGILEAITDKLIEAELAESVVRGERARTTPAIPALWVYGIQATPNHDRRSYAEMWVFEVAIVAVVKSDKPEDGAIEATTLAAKARSEIIKDRSLGNRNYVQDTKSGRFEPNGPDMNKNNLYAASATIMIEFTILENNP